MVTVILRYFDFMFIVCDANIIYDQYLYMLITCARVQYCKYAELQSH